MNPSSQTTADAILQRLLLVLPRAAREEGVVIPELARDLEVDPRRIFQDLEELQARNFYLPAGLGDQFQLTVTREHLSVWTTGEFKRPVRLSPREALALELALRAVGRIGPADGGDRGGSDGNPGSDTGPDEDDAEAAASSRFDELRRRLVTSLRSPNAEEVEDPAVALGGAEAGDDPIRRVVEDAVRSERELRIVYGKPQQEPEARSVGPIVLVHAEGRWYLLARDLGLDAHRVFRLDRILEAEEGGAPFTPTAEDHAAAETALQDGRVHDGGGHGGAQPFEAVVQYSRRIARWIAEQGWEGAEPVDGGALRVRHRVVDPEWLVRHVLSYGAEAEVLEPGWIRERVVEVATRLS